MQRAWFEIRCSVSGVRRSMFSASPTGDDYEHEHEEKQMTKTYAPN